MTDDMRAEELTRIGEEALAHFGVLGMKWGIRKKEPHQEYESTVDGAAIGSPITKMDKTVHAANQDAAYRVSALLNDRYGYAINEIRAIDGRQFKNTLAYVESSSDGKNSAPKGTIHLQRRDMTPDMQAAEKSGWFAKDTGHLEALLTHETAHSMFHTDAVNVGTTWRPKYETSQAAARDKAWKASMEAAKADGIKARHFSKNVSGYANMSMWKEETEAELFSSYHWQSNPPRFIRVWGETLHREMGIDPTPFRKVKKNV